MVKIWIGLAVLRQRQAQILHASVRAHEHRLLGELRPDRSRRPGPKRRRKFELQSCREGRPS
jgi:hypothetical protein